jgi:hypothetical protein
MVFDKVVVNFNLYTDFHIVPNLGLQERLTDGLATLQVL